MILTATVPLGASVAEEPGRWLPTRDMAIEPAKLSRRLEATEACPRDPDSISRAAASASAFSASFSASTLLSFPSKLSGSSSSVARKKRILRKFRKDKEH